MMKHLALLSVLAALVAVSPVQAQGVVAVDIDINLITRNPVPTFSVTVNVRNFETVASFLLQVGIGGFGVPGAVITSFNDISNIADTPGAIQIINDNILNGGLNAGFPLVDFILLPPNCIQGLNCFDTSIFQPIINFVITTPPGTVADDIFIGTPNGPDEPTFGTIQFGSIPIDLDTPTPAPTPTPVPTPAPAPFMGRSISDPHMYGFNGQKYQFHGVPGKIYNLISDSVVGISMNALFAVAYTSGVTTDIDTLVIAPYVAQGTWVKAVGVQIGKLTLKVDSNEISPYPCSAGCFQNAVVELNGNPTPLLGKYDEVDFSMTLSNSKSFSRVELTSPSLSGKIDVVAPPAMWRIPDQDVPEFTHINVIIEKVSLVDGHGVLGETISIRRDVNGNPVMESSGENGEGILLSTPEGYEVASLL